MLKSLVYADKPQTLDHLEDNIRRVIADIRPQMLEKVIENWMSRLDYIRASRGSPMPEIIFKIETWTLNKDITRSLDMFERKILRTIFNSVQEGERWRTRYNFELYRLYQQPQITQVIRNNRLRWLDHIWRSSEDNSIKIWTFKKPKGTLANGRAPTR
ncbi:endonuclease-reverse transcriptase [Trichonephila clavipes]|nr:endonuclease-reverse transcriptase [Trichonephila clavipes]